MAPVVITPVSLTSFVGMPDTTRPVTFTSARIAGRTAEHNTQAGTLIIFQGTAIIARLRVEADATSGELWDMIHAAPVAPVGVSLAKVTDGWVPAGHGVNREPGEYVEAMRHHAMAPRLAALTGLAEPLRNNHPNALWAALAILAR